MLQFATDDSSRHTVEEQVSLALNAGCRWIRVTGNPSEDTIRSLIAPCQENDAILVLDNDIDLVDRLRVHGLHLTEWTRGSLIEARENLGPHAIIGVSCSDTTLLGELAGLDIDYLVAYAPAGQNQEDFYINFMECFRSVSSEIHPVAGGPIPVSLFPAILATGIEGFELPGNVADAPDSSAFIQLAMQSLG